MERLTALFVLTLGATVLAATALSLSLSSWQSTIGKVLLLLLVVLAMWRAFTHLRRPSHAH